jgi:hypothetical protein
MVSNINVNQKSWLSGDPVNLFSYESVLQRRLGEEKEQLNHSNITLVNQAQLVHRLETDISKYRGIVQKLETNIKLVRQESKNEEKKKTEMKLDSSQKQVTFEMNIRRMKSSVRVFENKIRSCYLGRKEVQKEMEKEQIHNIELWSAYYDAHDKCTALSSVLENYRLTKNKIDSKIRKEILVQVDMKYGSLKSETDKKIGGLLKNMSKNQSHQETVNEADNASLQVQTDLRFSKQLEEEQLRRIKTNEKINSESLSSCEDKYRAALQHHESYKKQNTELELKIQRLLKDIKENRNSKRFRIKHADVTNDMTKDMSELKTHLLEVEHKNQYLQRALETYQKSQEKDKTIIETSKTSNLKTQNICTRLKRDLQELQRSQLRSNEELKNHKSQLSDSDSKLKQCAGTIDSLKGTKEKLKKILDRSVSQEEKAVLVKRLKYINNDNDRLQNQFEYLTAQHGKMNQKMNELTRKNHDLIISTKKHQDDIQKLDDLTKKSSILNGKLDHYRKLVLQKASQLRSIAPQLSSEIDKNVDLQEQIKYLEAKLKSTSSPEEVEKLMQRLVNCKADSKSTQVTLTKYQQIINHLEQQSLADKNRIQLLMDTFKDMEHTKIQLTREQKIRSDIYSELRKCRENRGTETTELKSKIKMVEDQYANNLLEHKTVMEKSESKIRELEKELKEITKKNQTTKEQDHLQSINYEQAIKQLQKEVEQMKKGQVVRSKTLDVASALQSEHQNELNKHETELMSIRASANENFVKALEFVNENTDPAELQTKLHKLQQKDHSREKEKLPVMLEVRAIISKIKPILQQAEKFEWELLNKQKNETRATMRDLIKTGAPLPEVQKTMNEHQQISNELQKRIQEKNQSQLEPAILHQRNYLQSVHDVHLPGINESVRAMKSSIDRFPNLQKSLADFDQYKTDSRNALLNTIPEELNELTDLERTMAHNTNQLEALILNSQQTSRALQTYLNQPGPISSQKAQSSLSVTEDQILAKRKEMAELNNKNDVRVQFNITGRTNPSHLTIDKTKNQVTANGYKFYPDLLESDSNVSPNFFRASESRLDKIYDFIIVSYSNDNNTTSDNDKPLRLVLLTHALNAAVKKLNENNETPTGYSIVKLTLSDERLDVLNLDKPLKSGCDYDTCNPKIIETLKTDEIQEKITEAIKNSTDHSGNHIVLSIKTDRDRTIHICDILFNISPVLVKLLDQTWVNYLSTVIEKKDIKIDLLFTANASTTQEDADKNRAMFQLSDRLRSFLQEYKRLSKTE